MAGNSKTPADLKAGLSIINQDKRLERLFGPHGEGCAIELWVLQSKNDEALETRLLYGRVSAVDFSNSSWSAPRKDRFKIIRNGLSAQCVRLTAYLPSTSMLNLLLSLTEGANLADASKACSLFMDDQFETRFGAVTMASPLAFRPVMHLPSRSYFQFWASKVGPVDACSADSAAISSLMKSEIFVIAGEDDPELARFAIDALDTDTGLKFSGLDAWRLGDLELLALPGRTKTGASRVHVDVSHAGLSVTVDEPLAGRPSNFRVSARYFNDDGMFYCGAAMITNDASYPTSVALAIPAELSQIVDACVVEIETQEPDSAEARLCFQWGAHFVREIAQTLHVSGGQARVKNDWLAKALRPVHAKRLEEAQQIARHTERTESSIGGRKADPWVTANRHMLPTMKRLLPPRSTGRFFLRYSEGENTGRLELAEWIKRLLAEHRDKHVAWFDPYMEDMGIHLLNQYGSESGNYIIFTGSGKGNAAPWWEHVYSWTTGVEAPEDRIDSRIANLQAACHLWNRRIGTVRLRVFALPQADLHDRMVLIRDARMRPVAGYHLSNSLQRANENYPLLITPIPIDVLQLVFEYTDDLLRRSIESRLEDSGPKLKCLFDSENDPGIAVTRREPVEVFQVPRMGEVLDWWLSSSALAGADAEAIRIGLDGRGLLLEGQLRHDAFQELPSKIWDEGVKLPRFNSAWDALGSLLASTPAGDSIREAPDHQVPALHDALLEYLDSDRPDAIQPPESRSDVDMTGQLRRTLADLLRFPGEPSQLFHYDITEVSWGDYYAIKVLWATEPATLAAWIEQGAEERFQTNRRRQLGLKCAVRLISSATQRGVTIRQLEALLKRKNGLLRWIGYVAFETLVIEDPQVLYTTQATSLLSPDDRLQLLGWLTARASPRSRFVRDSLINELLVSLPAKLGASDLTKLVNSLRNVLGNVYDSPPWILQDILTPLLQQNRIDIDAVAALWFEELVTAWTKAAEERSILFRREIEGRFTDEVGDLCGRASADVNNSIGRKIKKELAEYVRVVQRPFSADVDWGAHDRAFRLILWIDCFLRAWLERSPRPSKIEEILMDAEVSLKRRSDAEWKRSSAAELLRQRTSHML